MVIDQASLMKVSRVILSGLMILLLLLTACGCNNLLLLHPKGPIGGQERFLIIISFLLMLIVVVPVIVMSIWFPLKYRAGNTKAPYAPKWCHSVKIEIIVWLIPAAIVFTLSILIWIYTHKLDPYKPLESNGKTTVIEAISLNWKWLFIYPEKNIAVINQIAFPAEVPVSFRITSTTVMTSLFIPQLGSQIYAMAGMQTHLNLLAKERGTYVGQNQQYSGAGYSDMHFQALATSTDQFEAWIQKAKQSSERLTWDRFRQLEKPSSNDTVTFFSTVAPGLFDSVIYKFNTSMKAMKEQNNTEQSIHAMPMEHCGSKGN